MWRQIVQPNSGRSSLHRLLLLKRLQSSVRATTTTQHAAATIVPLSRRQRKLSSLQHQHDGSSSSTEMKTLLETLQVALASPRMPPVLQPSHAPTMPAVPIVAEPEEDIVHEQHDGTNGVLRTEENTREAAVAVATATAARRRPIARNNLAVVQAKKDAAKKQVKERIQYERKIQALMNKNSTTDVIRAVRNAAMPLNEKFLYNVFRFFLTRNPLYSSEILQRHFEEDKVTLDMYERQCRAVATLGSSHGKHQQTKYTVEQLCNQIVLTQTREDQFKLLPILLESTLASSLNSVRSLSTTIYDFLIQQDDFKFEAEYLERLCHYSRYYQNYLPFASVLQQLAATGVAPENPPVIAQALAQLFPFVDMEVTQEAVQAVYEIVHNGTNIPLDVGTLEAILSAAARSGKFDLGLLTWDLVDSLGHEPTEGMYECMVQAFVMSYRQDHRAFACLVEMEEAAGFTPSRALLRSMSRSLRFSASRIDNAYRMLVSYQQGCKPTQAALNAIMSGTAELGDVDRTFSVLLDDFPVNKMANPNQDSYSFAMESLAKNSERKDEEETPPLSDEEKRSVVKAAEQLLDMMTEGGTLVDGNVLHAYVQVLINCDELELATKTALDALDSSYELPDYTIILLVHEHGGKHKNFALSRDLAKRTREPLTFLWKRIQKWEDKARMQGFKIVDDNDAEVETIKLFKEEDDEEEAEIPNSGEGADDEDTMEHEFDGGLTLHEQDKRVPAA